MNYVLDLKTAANWNMFSISFLCLLNVNVEFVLAKAVNEINQKTCKRILFSLLLGKC